MINRELKLFFTALSFYTRLPAPAFIHGNNAGLLPDSIRYLPLIGWMAGIVAAIVYLLANYLFGDTLAVLFSMVATVLLTGAFHEDGFADVCDGFGGGWTKDRILDIMKDSRLGTYGVLGLILLLGIKFFATIQVTAS
jgi:adenosylcobinamide-GDP ribazoletransferase